MSDKPTELAPGNIDQLPALDVPTLAASPALRIWFDDDLFNRAKNIAMYLSRAKGITPPHLIGQSEACFAVVSRALSWRLDPFAVAQSTYATPGGQVGYEGKLCQAILLASGRIDGAVNFEHYGDWSKVQGKFEIAKSKKGNDYPKRLWGPDEAEGLGVTVSALVKGEQEPRALDFDLRQAFPLNSTLWATDPKTQICYTAVRRFASVRIPELLMGVPFSGDDPAAHARDITPPRRPARADYSDFPDDTPEKRNAGELEKLAEQDRQQAEAERERAEAAGMAAEPETAPEGEAEPRQETDQEQGDLLGDAAPSTDMIVAAVQAALSNDDLTAYLKSMRKQIDAMGMDDKVVINDAVEAQRVKLEEETAA